MINFSKKNIQPSQTTVYDACLLPLLKALRWKGKLRQIKESLPHYSQLHSVHMLNDVLKNLNFESNNFFVDIKKIDIKLLPCIFQGENEVPILLISKSGSKFKIFDTKQKKYRTLLIKETSNEIQTIGKIHTFKKIAHETKNKFKKTPWIRNIFLKNRSLLYSSLAISFILSILTISTPLFVMFVYNRVIQTASISMLVQFSIGMMIVFVGFFILSQLRATQLAIVGARFDNSIGNNIFERLLYLSPHYTESASLGAQVARLKDFSRLRDFITGQLMTLFFELPFVTVAIIIVAVLGGLLALIPFSMIIIYVLLGIFLYRETQRRIDESSTHHSKQQEFTIETLNKLRAIKYSAATETWKKRYRDLAANTTFANFKNTMLISINNAISDILMMGTGIAVLGFSTVKIIHGTLSIGAMLAIMMLSWRLLVPLKTIFNTYTRVLQMQNSMRQISRLMQLETESKPTDLSHMKISNLRGKITFNKISLRYPDTHQPALLGVSFDIQPGQWIGIVGHNGSGKSSIFKLLLRIYQQQAGNILIDDQDIRQFNEIELRSTIAYLPQIPELFYGTIASNLRLANPAVRDTILLDAAKKTGLLDAILALPQGFATHLRDFSANQLSHSFQQRLCLTRALIKQSPILLLDEPANSLDEEGDKYLMDILKMIRGKATILMVTHRPSHMKEMDHLLILDNGTLIQQGPPKEILPEIQKRLL